MTLGKKRLSTSDVQYFAHTVRVCIFAHTDTVYENRTDSDRTFAHNVSVNLLIYCNWSVHNQFRIQQGVSSKE